MRTDVDNTRVAELALKEVTLAVVATDIVEAKDAV
jgi:hypothetical protein